MSDVVLTRRARKDLEQLDAATRQRIIDKLNDYAEDPLLHAVRWRRTQVVALHTTSRGPEDPRTE